MTTNQIFTLRMEKCWEFNEDLHHVFIDFKQAYDNIKRSQLWEIMTEFGIPIKLNSLIKICTIGSRNRIKIDGTLSECFDINSGLKQGDALSPLLFNRAGEGHSRY